MKAGEQKPPKKQHPLCEFGVWTKLRLIERQMTSVDLCNQVGIPNVSYLSKILHGTVSGGKYIAKIMDVLGDNTKGPNDAPSG